MHFKLSPRAMTLPAFVLVLLAGCLGIDQGDGLSNSEKQQKADSAASAGTDKLSDAFEDMTDGGFKYGEGDLTGLREANARFKAALDLQSDNNRARMGAAVTGVLLAAQSAELSGLINQTLEAESPLNPDLTRDAYSARVAVLGKVASASLPEIHELQDAVADTLLPALENGIALLQAVYQDHGFSMSLEIDGSSKEIDHGEVGILLAGFKTLHALSTLVLAYDYDFDHDGSYDYLRVLDTVGRIEDFSQLSPAEKSDLNALTGLLASTSPFLAVRPAWKNRLAQVDDNLAAALDVLKESLASIKTETDSQSDDLLRVCAGTGIQSGCIGTADLDAGLKSIDSLRKYIAQPYPVSFADTTVLVNFAAYFNVQDYKKMWPYYKFYDAAQWSDAKPVLYFTNPSGAETGNLKTLADLMDRAHANDWTTAEIIDSLKPVIRWQDPTFQGFLPGATEAKVWRLIEITAENWADWTQEDEDCYDCWTDNPDYWDTTGVIIIDGKPPVVLTKTAKKSAKRPHGLTLANLFSPRLPLLLIGK